MCGKGAAMCKGPAASPAHCPRCTANDAQRIVCAARTQMHVLTGPALPSHPYRRCGAMARRWWLCCTSSRRWRRSGRAWRRRARCVGGGSCLGVMQSGGGAGAGSCLGVCMHDGGSPVVGTQLSGCSAWPGSSHALHRACAGKAAIGRVWGRLWPLQLRGAHVLTAHCTHARAPVHARTSAPYSPPPSPPHRPCARSCPPRPRARSRPRRPHPPRPPPPLQAGPAAAQAVAQAVAGRAAMTGPWRAQSLWRWMMCTRCGVCVCV